MFKYFFLPLLLIFIFLNNLSLALETDSELLFNQSKKYEESLVVKVNDSDTVVLENGTRLKMIGIDSFGQPPRPKIKYDEKGRPIESQEIQPSISLEEQAIAYAQNLIEGKKVKIEYDIESRDYRGRKTGYVFLPDGTLANVEILRQGFVKLSIRPPNIKYENEFKKAYLEARKEQRGFLSD